MSGGMQGPTRPGQWGHEPFLGLCYELLVDSSACCEVGQYSESSSCCQVVMHLTMECPVTCLCVLSCVSVQAPSE